MRMASRSTRRIGLTASSVESFGVDFAGELYMISGNNIVKIAPVS